MAKSKAGSRRSAEAEAWRRLFQFFMYTRPQRDRIIAELGLTPNDMRALSALDTSTGRTMRSLADQWGCDASNATWIIDRLEKLRLAQRRGDPNDRRVKLVVLTDRGARTLRRALDAMWEPPPELTALSRKELDSLLKILARLPASEQLFGRTG